MLKNVCRGGEVKQKRKKMKIKKKEVNNRRI